MQLLPLLLRQLDLNNSSHAGANGCRQDLIPHGRRCTSLPLPEIPKLIETDEAGDEWLHERCDYKGVVTAKDVTDARRQALAKQGNVIEPLTAAMSETGPFREPEPSLQRVEKVFYCAALTDLSPLHPTQ
jgi:hypothetical protein